MATNIFCPTTTVISDTSDVTFEKIDIVAELTEVQLQVDVFAGAGGSVIFPNNFSVVLSAAEDIAKGKVVRATSTSGEVLIADSSDISNYGNILGVAKTSAILGGVLEVVTAGLCQDPMHTFTPGSPVFFDVNGDLTQTPPTTGFLLMVGKAIASDTVHVDLEEAILF